jgi:hypothetical protein
MAKHRFRNEERIEAMSIDVTAFVDASGPTEFKALEPGVYKVSCLDVSEIENDYGQSFQMELQVQRPRRKMRVWLNKPREQMDWNKLDLCFKSFGKNIVEAACDEVDGKVQFNPKKVGALKGGEAAVELSVSNDGKNNRVAKWLPVGTKPNDQPQPAMVASDDDDDIPF